MASYANKVKLFGKWTYDDVKADDIAVEDFIAVKAKDQAYVPHTGGRYQVKRFRKAQCPIVERLVSVLMRNGRNNGKKLLGVRVVQQAFEIIHLMTDENPLQVSIYRENSLRYISIPLYLYLPVPFFILCTPPPPPSLFDYYRYSFVPLLTPVPVKTVPVSVREVSFVGKRLMYPLSVVLIKLYTK